MMTNEWDNRSNKSNLRDSVRGARLRVEEQADRTVITITDTVPLVVLKQTADLICSIKKAFAS